MVLASRARARAAVCAVALAVAASGALSCGFEDPGSTALRRGMLNLAYPQSLHVGTAVWQAQLAGALPRDPLAERADLSPDARATLGRVRVNGLLMRFAARLAKPADEAASLAVVLLDSVMWSRFVVAAGAVHPVIHVAAPEAGDVVVVTDTPVLEAIAAGSLELATALELGLIRLYGAPPQVAGVRAWFAALARS